MREQTVRKYGLVYSSQANQCETQCQSEPYINKEYSPTNAHELSLILFEKIRLYRQIHRPVTRVPQTRVGLKDHFKNDCFTRLLKVKANSRMQMYVYTHMRTCIYICSCILTYVWYIPLYMQVNIHFCMQIMYICLCMSVCICNICMYVTLCMYACNYVICIVCIILH